MKLTEIQAVIDGLPPAEKQQLLLFLAARLRGLTGPLPAPRRFSPSQMQAWIDDDETQMRNLRDSRTP